MPPLSNVRANYAAVVSPTCRIPERKNEPVEFRLTSRVDVGESLSSPQVRRRRQHLFALLPVVPLPPAPRAVHAARILQGLTMSLQPEDIDRMPDGSPFSKNRSTFPGAGVL